MKIYLAVDLQNDFIKGSLASPMADEVALAKIESYLSELYKIYGGFKSKQFSGRAKLIYTLDTHDESYLQTQEGIFLPQLHCLYNSEGWQLYSSFAPAHFIAEQVSLSVEYDDIKKALLNDNILLVSKSNFSAFNLAKALRDVILSEELAVEEIEIFGICTDICVLNNALLLKAMMPDLLLSLKSDCCLGSSMNLHQKALDILKINQILLK